MRNSILDKTIAINEENNERMLDYLKKETYLTNAPKKEQFTLQNDGTFPNEKNIDGDSVNEHKNQEVANSLFAEKEISQQQENL